MGFLENLEGLAGDLLGGTSPQAVADAAVDHVQNADPNELGDHLTQSLGNLDGGSVVALGQHLLQSFMNNGGGSADDAAAAAGTSADAVASGDQGAVGQLIEYAKSNPQVLQQAAGDFMQGNPGAIAQLAPGLLQGIMSRLGGGSQ
jgi:hypothetical protein